MVDWKPRQPSISRSVMEQTRAKVDESLVAFEFALGVIHAVADRRIPARISDPAAELRVVGWLLSGRAVASDVAEIEPADFSDIDVRMAYALALSLVEMADAGRVARASSGLLLAVVEAHMAPHLGTIERLMTRLPCPAGKPTREIDLVASLGRAWSAIADKFEERAAMQDGDN